MKWRIAGCLALLAGLSAAGMMAGQEDLAEAERAAFCGWARAALCGEPSPVRPVPVGLELRRQDHGEFGRARNCIGDPLRIGEKRYEHGLGTHSTSELLVHLPQPAVRLEAEIGIDNDRNTLGRDGTVVFAAEASGKEVYRSGVRRGSDPPLPIRVELGGARRLVLRVLDGGDGPSCDHGDWAEAAVLQADGKRLYLDELPLLTPPARLETAIPYSFVYGGKPSSGLLPVWKRTEKHQKLDDGRRRHAITHTDPATGLEVTCDLTLYADFPAAEWVLTLRNGGSRDTPILQKVRPLDLAGELSTTGKLVLHYANGSTASPTDYQPFDEPLRPGADLVLASSGGRSSNGRFPFFNLDWGEGGLAGAIGWSGQWQLRAARDKQRGFQLQARQQVTHFLLHPGESVRTPRILLIGWQQDRLRGHNMLRRLIYRWHTPLLGKEKPLPPTQCNTWFPVGDNGGNANEKNQVELLEAYAGLGIEYLVMDAGWYGTSPAWWANVGTWVPRRDTFPRGLGPVGAAAKRAGIRFGLWFEPERVRPGSQLDREHPEWLLKTDEKTDRLLNLGLPEAQQWFVELISRYVEEVPLGYFRHDFNIDPLPFWTKADAPDRAGISEIRYVEGLYKVWDTLRTRHPGLMMEGCASGGRRIDLESITRFHTYWKADLYGNLLANQCHVYGANLYLPSNYFNTPLFDLPSRDNRRGHPYTDPAVFDLPDNPYAFRSLLGGALCCGWDPRIEGFDRDLARARIDRFKALRPLTVGDFYPLLPYSLERSHWMAYQFHRDDLQEGMALVFRRAASPYAAVDVALRGLEPERQYEVTCEGLAEPGDLAGRKTGHALGRKLRVTIDRAAGSALIRYRPVADE